MNRIKLTTEDIFVKDGIRAKVLTSGIDLSTRFNNNPVMLLGHNPEKIIGRWDSVETINNEITAIPNFDEDEASAIIAQKYVKGTIKSAAIGSKIDESFLEGDVLVISKSTLMEASMVSIPANVEAKKIELAKDNIVFLSEGKPVNLKMYTNKLKEDMKNNKVEEVEVIETNDKGENIEESIVSTNDNTEKLEEVLASKLELSLKLKSSDIKIAKLLALKETLTLSIATKDNTIADLEATITSLTNDKKEVLLDGAVKDGKITNEGRVDFEDLSYDKIESILNKLVPTEMSLSQTLVTKRAIKEDIKDYAWYLANDKGALSKMSKENPSLLKQLEDNYKVK